MTKQESTVDEDFKADETGLWWKRKKKRVLVWLYLAVSDGDEIFEIDVTFNENNIFCFFSFSVILTFIFLIKINFFLYEIKKKKNVYF